MTWTGGSALNGARIPSSDVDFYLDNEMIHIADVKIARNFAQYFIHSIGRLNV